MVLLAITINLLVYFEKTTMAAESESLEDIITAVPHNASIVFDFEKCTLKIGD
jgi:hypothetical protein